MPRDTHYAICAICAGSGTGVGYHVPPRFQPLWLCDSPECLTIAKATYSMPQKEFDRIEKLATLEAGQALERYCEQIGKVDFSTFTQSEFEEAMHGVILEYRNAMTVKLRDEAPF